MYLRRGDELEYFAHNEWIDTPARMTRAPDLLIVQGDTSSALGAALAGFMTGERVNDIIGYPGTVFSRSDEPGFHSLSRKYKACGGGFVIIDMQREKSSQPYRVTQKFAVWA